MWRTPRASSWGPEWKTTSQRTAMTGQRLWHPLDHQNIQLFRERLSQKMCTWQSRRGNIRPGVIWDMISTVTWRLKLSDLLLLSFSTRRHISMAFRANSSKFLWKKENSKPPTMPFRIVACTFSDNLSRNSYKQKNRLYPCSLVWTSLNMYGLITWLRANFTKMDPSWYSN